MWTCNRCDSEVPDNREVCPYCDFRPAADKISLMPPFQHLAALVLFLHPKARSLDDVDQDTKQRLLDGLTKHLVETTEAWIDTTLAARDIAKVSLEIGDRDRVKFRHHD